MSHLRAALAAAWRYPRPRLAPAHLVALRRGEDRLIGELKNGAPGWTPGTPPTCKPNDCLESKAMETLQRQAQQLQPGDIITAHPDHPERQVWYRVATWPRRVTAASVLIDYTCRPEHIDGDTCGVLMLDLDQPCTVVPAHACGGAR